MFSYVFFNCRNLRAVTIILGCTGFFVPAASLSAQTGDNAAALTGNADSGRGLYDQYSCYACHGHSGETGSGTRLNPPRFDQAGFIAYIRNPSGMVVGGGPGGKMPAYAGDNVTDQNLADIYAYIHALPSGSPPLEDIPLLNK